MACSNMENLRKSLSSFFSTLSRPRNLVQIIGGLAVILVLYGVSLRDYLLFHSIIEIFSIVIAFTIFILVWNTRRTIPDIFFIVIAISFLFTGAFDLIHTLAYKGMGVFPGYTADLPTQLWIAARYFQSITFFIATLLIGKALTRNRNLDTAIIFAVFGAASAVLFASIFVWPVFPHCFIEGIGLTPFKIVSEYIIATILALSIIVLYVKRSFFDPAVWQLLIAGEIFLIAGELAFTSYISVYGFMNMTGHLFKLVSFYLFYRAIVVVGLTRPYDLLYREVMKKQRALEESETKYRSLFDHMEEGSGLYELVRDEQGIVIDYRFLAVNPASERLRGISGASAIGRLGREVFGDPPPFLDVFSRVERTGKAEVFESFLEKTGKHVTISVFTPQEGKVATTVVDLTDLKMMERALQLTNRKLGLLSSITRHDILNQLLALQGYLTLSRDSTTDPGRLAGYLEKAETVAKTIESQISFTKEYQELGGQAPTWQNVESAVKRAVAALPVGKIRVVTRLEGIEVYADPLLGRVFFNLIQNALMHGGEGLTTIRVAALPPGPDLVIVCEDDGRGIAEQDREHLFERGFGKNTGLGLFLSREILSITGMTIGETSEPGKGARFEIRVPGGVFRISSSPA